MWSNTRKVVVGIEHTDLVLEGRESPIFCGYTLANLAESLQFCVFPTGSIFVEHGHQ